MSVLERLTDGSVVLKKMSLEDKIKIIFKSHASTHKQIKHLITTYLYEDITNNNKAGKIQIEEKYQNVMINVEVKNFELQPKGIFAEFKLLPRGYDASRLYSIAIDYTELPLYAVNIHLPVTQDELGYVASSRWDRHSKDI